MPSGIRKGLTPARILEEAFAIVDKGGPEALTMRALAQRLDVAAMALYNHFHDREAILDSLAEQVFAAFPPAGRGKTDQDWKSKLRKLLMGAHKLASRHPLVYRLAMTRPNKPASAFAVTEEAIKTLSDAGLAKLQAQTVYHTFVILLQGYPFWREGYDRHNAICGGTHRSADKQFAESVSWLLDSIELLLLRNAVGPEKSRARKA